MNQQQNTLVAYMTCKNLTIRCASIQTHSSVSQSLCSNPNNPFHFTRARVALSSPSRYARSSSHRCGTLHPGVKRRLERDEPESRQYESHFFVSVRRALLWSAFVLSDSCESNRASQIVERTNGRWVQRVNGDCSRWMISRRD